MIEQRANINIYNVKLNKTFTKTLAMLLDAYRDKMTMSHWRNARAQCGKVQKSKYQKSASTEIKSKNHAHYFLFRWDYP